MSFRFKLLASYAALVVAVLLAVDLQLNQALSRDLQKDLDRQLERHARGAGEWIADDLSPARVAGRIAREADARVTIIASDGRVLADSERADTLDQLDNHGDRPEVREARERGVGRATRRSATTSQSMRYVAVTTGDLVVRVAVPVRRVSKVLSEMRLRLVGASVVAFLLAIVLGIAVSRLAARPLAAMTAAASRLAGGDFDVNLPSKSSDEFGALARSLTSLATQLRDKIGDVTSERDRLSAMLEGMLEGVLVVSPELRVVLANSAAAQILEVAPLLVGRTVAETIRHPQARAAIEGAVTQGRTTEVEIELRGARGRAVWLGARSLPAHAGGGAVAVLHDVTQLRRLEAIRRDFVTNVSHELRTPVASIQSYAETLADGALEDPATARKFVEVIHRNASRLGRLVGDLLTLARLEARESIVCEQVPIADVVRQVLDTVRERAAGAGVELVADAADDVAALGVVDGVEQILLNLVDNALKYSKRGGRVTVSARLEGDWVGLVVEDDGPGIESRHLPRLFERFYRVDEGRALDQGGTGLGLAIVKHLAESMGGQVSAASEVGRGSRFTLRIPASRPAS